MRKRHRSTLRYGARDGQPPLMHLVRQPPICCHLCGASCGRVLSSTDSQLAKGADAAAATRSCLARTILAPRMISASSGEDNLRKPEYKFG